MKLLLKRVLVNILVLMVVMLPLRNVFAVPMTMSPDHCAEIEMAMMDHVGHTMPSMDFQNTLQDQQAAACACCNQCDADCTGCIHITAAITFDFLQLSEIRSIELVSVTADSLLSRTLSPPSRPPLTL